MTKKTYDVTTQGTIKGLVSHTTDPLELIISRQLLRLRERGEYQHEVPEEQESEMATSVPAPD